MATEAIGTVSFLFFLCTLATPGMSATLTTKPSSLNISVDAVAEFVCEAQENRVSAIIWTNVSSITSPFLENNASLGITIGTTGDETSSQRKSTLRIEGRQEYNGTRVRCTANGFSIDAVVTSAMSEEATLLIQGRLDPVPNLRFTEIDDCCKRVKWNMPYSLAGVPILGYNVTSPDLNVGKFVTGSTRTVVCSNQPQRNNAIVSVQGYIGVDGGISSIALDFSIDTQPEIQVGREQLSRGGIDWTLPITIVDLVCSGLSQDLDKLAITVADELTGLVIVQTEVMLNGTTAANILVPDDTKFSLQGNFSLTFRNGLSLSSTFSFERTISTFDFRNISIDYDPGNKTCLQCEAIANSRAAGCLLLVNSTENETDQRALIITPTSANIYRTCVDVVPGVYNLTAYDISSDARPLTATPAVVLTDVLVSPTVPTTTPQMPTDDTPSAASPTSILVITGSVTLAVVFLVILIPIVMVIIIKKGCLSKEAPSDEQGKKLEENKEEESVPKEGVQKETGQEETGNEEPSQDVSTKNQ